MDIREAFPMLRGRKVIVFDGACVLCSAFFRFVLRHDCEQRFHFLIAQSPTGEALYTHFGLKPADYESNLVLIDGRLFTDLDALAAVLAELGPRWRPFAAIRFLPARVKTFLYDRIARNRYAMFGRRDTCYRPTPELEARFLG